MKRRSRFYLELLLLVIIPAALGIMEIFHPISLQQHVFATLEPIHHRWLLIHYVQSFLFAIMAIAVYYLTRKDNDSILVWLARINLFIFIVTYTVLDAAAGITVGRILTYSETYNMNPVTINDVVQHIFNDPIIGGIQSVYSLVGSYTWLFAMLLTVLYFAIRFWNTLFWQILPSLILLLICGYSLYTSHANPYGPIAFISFALACAWLMYVRNKTNNQFF